jgi:hypothetical protein
MIAWSDWEVVRHRVAIGGRVVTATKQSAAQAVVTLKGGPKAFTAQVESELRRAGPQWEVLRQRIDRTETGEDGTFFFLDLLAGRYRLQCGGDDGQAAEEKTATVTVTADRDGHVRMTAVEVLLPKDSLSRPA